MNEKERKQLHISNVKEKEKRIKKISFYMRIQMRILPTFVIVCITSINNNNSDKELNENEKKKKETFYVI